MWISKKYYLELEKTVRNLEAKVKSLEDNYESSVKYILGEIEEKKFPRSLDDLVLGFKSQPSLRKGLNLLFDYLGIEYKTDEMNILPSRLVKIKGGKNVDKQK